MHYFALSFLKAATNMFAKKTKSLSKNTYPDRFIPRRRDDTYGSPLDYPPKKPEAPFDRYLYEAMQDPEGSRVLLFSPEKPSNPLTPPHCYPLRTQVNRMFSPHKDLGSAPKLQVRPIKILDAPNVLDDFYSNTMFWSQANNFVIALSPSDGQSRSSTLYNMQNFNPFSTSTPPINQAITIPDNIAHAVMPLNETKMVSGWHDGTLKLHTLGEAENRSTPFIREIDTSPSIIYSLLRISLETFACGNGEGELMHVDLRTPLGITVQLKKHHQQITALTYNGAYGIASGGNDNQIKLWDIRYLSNEPINTNSFHSAAVKALAFQPNAPRYLVSGGGTVCKKLCYWDIYADAVLSTQDTFSQISGIQHLNDPNYFVSIHGHSDPSLKLWKLSKGHFLKVSEVSTGTGRTLSVAKAPEADVIATLNTDETLRFFHVKNIKSHKDKRLPSHPSEIPTFGALTIR